MNDTTRQLADSGLRYDHVGLMIILRSFSLLQTILHLRKIAVLDSYFDGLGLMVWPKALLAVDALVERISLSPGTPGSLSTLASAASSLMNPPAVAVAAATKLKKFGLQLMKPKNDEHESTTFALDETRIYASFVSMLYKLEFDISVNSFSTSADKLTELVFLVNNYDLVVSILKENELSLVDSEFVFWTDLLDETINNYCEETLDFYFGYLTRFVKQQATKGENKGDENRDLGAKKVKEPIRSSDTSPLNGRRGNGDSAVLEIPPLITQFNYEWKMQIANRPRHLAFVNHLLPAFRGAMPGAT
ncbi:hypothetical protein AX774_g6366 [Zancudomyces culisetae]|uniref:Vps52 C-terminal domain-containing protein n=1 Tax=Zancudomyces culisetae TaxID=1213189 RepID=A0A1R1PGY7_ZANCU|nr:hypothetical protein AX774_g6366 [Zancudomyces culisetae]|eukprot:OMH80208.1 hypothetical protein AX774_g6366 [Zancudomyces culisetae]